MKVTLEYDVDRELAIRATAWAIHHHIHMLPESPRGLLKAIMWGLWSSGRMLMEHRDDDCVPYDYYTREEVEVCVDLYMPELELGTRYTIS